VLAAANVPAGRCERPQGSNYMELKRIATVALMLKVTQPAAFSSIISVCTGSLVGVAPFRFEAVPTRPVSTPAMWRAQQWLTMTTARCLHAECQFLSPSPPDRVFCVALLCEVAAAGLCFAGLSTCFPWMITILDCDNRPPVYNMQKGTTGERNHWNNTA
jgi:hypothetical protein